MIKKTQINNFYQASLYFMMEGGFLIKEENHEILSCLDEFADFTSLLGNI
jgi:hypothetical protein